MVVFPNCKINLGLHVLNKRADGYHDLSTVFYPISFTDALEIIRSNHDTNTVSDVVSSLQFSQSGIVIQGDASSNLCVKAYHLLKDAYPNQVPNVAMHLHKIISMGAGLGGGSADGAFTLTALNDKFHLELTKEQLMVYALQLGSDCPFFIENKPCIAGGRGELLTPITLDLSAYQFVLVNPNIHISTGWAFSNVTPKAPIIPIEELINQPITNWKQLLTNDFEAPAIQHYPIIGTIKNYLYDFGALYSSMTGSGSTVFGIFHRGEVPKIQLNESYFTFISE
jgi:4-diphosphocytidyl-2-C-methyl-D-erythritol kinase